MVKNLLQQFGIVFPAVAAAKLIECKVDLKTKLSYENRFGKEK